jgi:uncharacterized protein DUF4157
MAEGSSKESGKNRSDQENEGHVRESQPARLDSSGPQGILALQRYLGNQAVSRFLRSTVDETPSGASASGRNENATPVSQDSTPTLSSRLARRASSEAGRGLEDSVRAPMEDALGEDLGHVRVHTGPASDAASESFGARAYTVGSDIYLGAEARRGSEGERNRLLAHEAVHTVQQGGQPASLQGKLSVSHPEDGPEVEAERIAASVMSRAAGVGYSPSLALRNQMRTTTVAPQTVSRVVGPLVQRDLKGPHKLPEGTFTMNMKEVSNAGGDNGMFGTISFKADTTKAPDSKNIRLLQVAKVVNLTTGKDHLYTGSEANRNKVMTPSGIPGVQPGFFVDVVHANRSPRTKKTDPDVSPYYIEDYKSLGIAENKDGSKQGKTVTEASLRDFPHWNVNSEFSFETVAKDADSGHVYGTVMWGFTISDAAKGKVEKQRAVGREVTLKSTDIAIEKFNEFYKNKGSSTAP